MKQLFSVIIFIVLSAFAAGANLAAPLLTDLEVEYTYDRTGSGQKLGKSVYVGPKPKVPTRPGVSRSNSLGGYPAFPRDSVLVYPTDSIFHIGNTTLTKYFGAYEYINGKFARLNTATGYRDSEGTHVYVRDWQGNIRAVVRKGADGKVELEQATYYYPYGMPMAESTNPTINKYKYTGKELLTDHGVNILDYGPRPYDPTTGIWWSVDEHSADYASMSHYTMCAGDPINHIDPDGKDWIYHDEFGYKWDKNITAESKLEDGWVYVGSENNSILEHLGLSGTSYSYSMKCMGAGGSNYEEGQGFSYNNLMVNINLFFKFTPLINSIVR